jgi:hypothetical protein
MGRGAGGEAMGEVSDVAFRAGGDRAGGGCCEGGKTGGEGSAVRGIEGEGLTDRFERPGGRVVEDRCGEGDAGGAGRAGLARFVGGDQPGFDRHAGIGAFQQVEQGFAVGGRGVGYGGVVGAGCGLSGGRKAGGRAAGGLEGEVEPGQAVGARDVPGEVDPFAVGVAIGRDGEADGGRDGGCDDQAVTRDTVPERADRDGGGRGERHGGAVAAVCDRGEADAVRAGGGGGGR